MPGHIYTIEELMLDDSFINYCLSTGAAVPSEWRAIIRENPEQEKTFEEAKKLVLSLHGGLSRLEVNRQIEIVRQRLGERSSAADEQTVNQLPVLSSAFVTGKGRIRKRSLRTVLSYAAVFCLLLTTGWWMVFRQTDRIKGSEASAAQAIHYQSPLGQRRVISLPDGSEVILNSNSSLTTGAGYNIKTREIHLSGNAFFKVARNPQKPFIVYSGNIGTTALGTEFYVHGKNDSAGNIQVDLLEGKVQLKGVNRDKPGQDIILLPGEAARSHGSELIKLSFDSAYLRHWIDGQISFNETPLMKAIEQLEKWYGIEIKIKSAGLESRSINGNYKEASIQDILKVICFSINRRYSITGNTIIIE